jgi:Protein of unknown function (DUF1573)
MNKLVICLVIVAFFINACHNTVNKYENSLGIEPGLIAQIDTANYTTIEWEDTLRNFGTVKEGDSVFIKFRFKNTGDKVLFLTNVQSSCGCTVADYPQNAILPGKGGEVVAIYNSRNHPGYIHKTITVTANTSNKIKHLLSFTGNVKESLSSGH